jgi:hypothetical protein
MMNKYQEAFANVKRACIVPFLGRKPIDICGVSLDRLKELVERATPKKPTEILLRCPNCNHKVGFNYYVDKHVDYCPTCGQALDWGEEE